MPSDTRERLIDAALKRFKRDGFREVGVEQIFGDVGISRTAFYKHFASKEDLMVAALDVQTRILREIFRDKVRERGGPTAVGQLRALFDVVETFVESDEFHGCVFINASIEFPLLHEPAHQAAMRNRAEIVEMIHALAERAGAANAMGMADELCMLIQGAYIARQMTGRRDVVGVARRMADDVIRRHLGMTTPFEQPLSQFAPHIAG
jgi:AcrR family transcriptional regulator